MALIKVRSKRGTNGKIIKEDKIWWCPACKRRHKVSMKWNLSGSIKKPTLEPDFIGKGTVGQAGIQLDGLPVKTCHCSIKDGTIIFHDDSDHSFSGKVVNMIDLNKVEEMENNRALNFEKMDPKTLFGNFFPKGNGFVDYSTRDMKRDI